MTVRTLEWAAIGSLDRYIEIPEVVVMWRSSDAWRWIRNKTFCLLDVREGTGGVKGTQCELSRHGRVDGTDGAP